MRLGDVCTKIGSGATPKGGKEAYKPSGIPFIRSQNVLDWSFTGNGLAFIDEGQATALANVEVEPNDILLNITGDSVARACMVPDWCTPARVNQHVSIVRSGSDLDPTFLLCFLQSSKPLLLKLASSGATRNALTKGMIGDLEIELPSIETQRAIATLIGQIQQKIVLNQQTNDYLEELFSLLYQRLIEENNCTYTPLTDVIFFQEGPGIRNWQYVYDGQGVNFINIRCIRQEHDFDLSNANQISKEEAYGKYKHFLVEPGDILMSSSGTLGRYAIARSENLPLCMNTSVIRFRPLKDPGAYAFVYGYLTSQEFYSHLTNMSTGSAQVNFGPTHLKKIEVPLPSNEAIHAFNRQAQPIIDCMVAMHSENGRLAKLRDTLLPKLMSGEIDVSKVDVTQLNNHLDDC